MNTFDADSHLIARFTRYLSLVAKHAGIDYFRQLQRYNSDNFRQTAESEPSVEFDVLYKAMQPPREDFEFEEARLAWAFAQLGRVRQQVLRYTFIHGLSSCEIAALIGCKQEYVRKIRSRALERLRTLIERGEL